MWLDSILWFVAIVAFVAVEAATTALVSVWFAVGGVAALLVSFFTGNLAVQMVVFAVVSAVALAVMVPTLAKRRKQAKTPVTNGSALTIGKQGVVLRAINPGDLGRVRVDGLDWQARADAPLPEGAKCRVTDAEGAVLTVTEVTVGAPV